MTARRIPWWLPGLAGLAIVLLGSTLLLRQDRGLTQASPPENVAQPIRLVCTGHIDVEGGVVSLHPVQAGRVVQVLVREGDQVPASAALLALDDQRARSQVRQAEEELKAAQARLDEVRLLPRQHETDLALQRSAIAMAEARCAAARQALQRQRGLQQIQQAADEDVQAAADHVRETEAAVQAERDRLARLQLVDVQAPIAQAEADAAARQARLDEARHALDECTLKAPTAGEVLRITTGPGDLLLPGQSASAILFCPAQPRIVRAEVPQEFAGQVQVGQRAAIQDDVRPAERWTGQVYRLSSWFARRRSVLQESLQRSDERTLECLIALDPGPPTRIGQRVRVTIQD